MWRLFVTISLALLAWVASSPALAQREVDVPSRVSLAISGCSEDRIHALREALRVELHALGSELDDAPSAEARLDLRCAPQGRVAFSVARRGTGRFFERLLTSQAASGRALALEIVELVRGAWATLAPAADTDLPTEIEARLAALELGDAERSAAARQLARAMQEQRSEHESTERRLEALEASPPAYGERAAVFVRGSVEVYGAGLIGLGGGRLGVDVPLGEMFRFVLAGGVHAGRVVHELGTVDMQTVAGSVAFLVRVTTGPLEIALGPAADLGWAHAGGTPRDPARVDGSEDDRVLGALGARASISGWVSPAWRLDLAIPFGFGLGGIDALASDARVASTEGPRVGIEVGVAWSP